MNKYAQHIGKLTRRFFPQWRLYGFSIAFWTFMFGFNRLLFHSWAVLISARKHKHILGYLRERYHNVIDEYANIDKIQLSPINSQAKIWVCWWDGERTMPPIVKVCYDFLLKRSGGREVIFISKYNFRDYVSIPDYILEKLERNQMTITHFSNILRVNLLFDHGGIWIDSTILTLKDFSFEGVSFFTLNTRTDAYHVYHSRWRGFTSDSDRNFTFEKEGINRWSASFLAGDKNNPLFGFVRDFFYAYWKDHDDLIDYPLVDYAFALACGYIPEFDKMINDVKPFDYNKFEMEENLNAEYSDEALARYSSYAFHKLNWKNKYYSSTKKQKLTMYGYLLSVHNSLENR